MNATTLRCMLILLVACTLGARMKFGFGAPQKATKPAPTTAENASMLQGKPGETPKGWFVPVEGYSARLVAEGATPGRHSVLLQKDGQSANAGPFGNIMRTFNAMPYRGKKLRFRAMVRFEGMPLFGRTQMWLRVDRQNHQMGFFDNMGNRPITNSAWRSYEITGPVADDAAFVNIGLMLLGDGKAWMDAVTIEVFDGKQWALVPSDHLSANFVPTAKALDPKTEQAIVAQLKARAVPLATVEAGHGFDDLAPLDKIVGDARIVALGEASHGTREFFQMKHRMLEYLVNKKGFTVFAIEANWPEAEVADRYVKTGEGDPVAALDAMYFWTWHTQEVADMIRWMRGYNKQPGKHPMLTFTSFDMQTPAVAAKQVLDYIGKADKADLESVTKAYSRFTPAHRAEPLKSDREALAADRAHAEEVAKLLDDKRAVLVQATSEADFRHARQCARIVQQAATMKAPGQNIYLVRDQSMAENVKWLADQAYPNQKMVLWAHNGHVGDGVIGGGATMGHHLRQMFGDKMVVLGFGFDRGQIRAVTMSGGKFAGGPVPQDVPPAIQGSSEAVLRQAGSPRFLLDFRSVPPASPLGAWLREENLFREPGAAWDPDQPQAFFSPMALSKTFDGIIFIAESHASELIPFGPRPK
jgi:erythromycin esterase